MKWHYFPVLILLVLTVLLLNFIIALKADAVDLGVWGESSSIAEEDFEAYVIKQLENLGENKLRAHQELIKNKIVANIKRPKSVKGISKATLPNSRLYDPSFIVQEDIYDHHNQLLYPSGMIINPLEKKAFEEVWILIDGDDLDQVTFAKQYNPQANKLKKIILVNGNPGIQEDGSFFFFDQMEEISNKLNISKVPSVIRQAPSQPQILIEEVALDNESGAPINNKNGEI